jgi:hypothetical protein
VIIRGDALGADWLVDRWAVDKSLKVERYPADWAKHRCVAGPICNKQMLEEGKAANYCASLSDPVLTSMYQRGERATAPIHLSCSHPMHRLIVSSCLSWFAFSSVISIRQLQLGHSAGAAPRTW